MEKKLETILENLSLEELEEVVRMCNECICKIESSDDNDDK